MGWIDLGWGEHSWKVEDLQAVTADLGRAPQVQVRTAYLPFWSFLERLLWTAFQASAVPKKQTTGHQVQPQPPAGRLCAKAIPVTGDTEPSWSSHGGGGAGRGGGRVRRQPEL